MKSSSIVVLVIGLASVALAAPSPIVQIREEHAKKALFGGSGENGSNGIFGQGAASNIFDGAACIVSSVIGGGNSRCQGRGAATTNDGVHYNYTYDTNSDGSLKVIITLEGGRSCTYNINANGQEVKKVIQQAAEKCSKEN